MQKSRGKFTENHETVAAVREKNNILIKISPLHAAGGYVFAASHHGQERFHMGGAVQHPLMFPVPDGLHGLRGMVTGVFRLFDMANGHFVEPIGMAQLLTAEVGVGAGVLRVFGVLDGLTGVLLGIVQFFPDLFGQVFDLVHTILLTLLDKGVELIHIRFIQRDIPDQGDIGGDGAFGGFGFQAGVDLVNIYIPRLVKDAEGLHGGMLPEGGKAGVQIAQGHSSPGANGPFLPAGELAGKFFIHIAGSALLDLFQCYHRFLQ
nr:MAG TPA: hypothetical protein [Caudoviricetes sp.]